MDKKSSMSAKCFLKESESTKYVPQSTICILLDGTAVSGREQAIQTNRELLKDLTNSN